MTFQLRLQLLVLFGVYVYPWKFPPRLALPNALESHGILASQFGLGII